MNAVLEIVLVNGPVVENTKVIPVENTIGRLNPLSTLVLAAIAITFLGVTVPSAGTVAESKIIKYPAEAPVTMLYPYRLPAEALRIKNPATVEVA
jgi:hypothetical protein